MVAGGSGYQRIGFDAVIDGVDKFVSNSALINTAINGMVTAINKASSGATTSVLGLDAFAGAAKNASAPLGILTKEANAAAVALANVGTTGLRTINTHAPSTHERLTGLVALFQRLIFVATGVATAMAAVALIRLPGQIFAGAFQAIADAERLQLTLQNLVAVEIVQAEAGNQAVSSIAESGSESAQKAAAAVNDVQERISDAMQDHAERVQEISAEIVATAGSGMVEIQERLSESLETLASNHARTLQSLYEDVASASAQFAEQMADRAAAFGQQMADLAARHAEQRARLMEDLDELNKDFADAELERQKELQEKLNDLEGNHNKKRGDLLKRLYLRTSAEKAKALLEGRLSEQEIYDLGLTDLAKSLKEEDSAYQIQVAEANKRAAEEEQRAQARHNKQVADLEKRIQREDEQYNRQAASAAAREAQAAARAERDHARKLADLQKRIDEENIKYEEQQAKLKADAAKDEEDRKKKNEEKLADLEQQLAKENKMYERHMRDLSQSLASVVAKQSAAVFEVKPYEVDPTNAQKMADAYAKAAPQAAELYKWNQRLAIESPFDEKTVSNAFLMFKGYGMGVDLSRDLTQSLIDYSAGTGRSAEQTERLALALGQMHSKGRLTGNEMKQFTEAGMGLEFMARAAGMSLEDFNNAMSEGALDAKQLLPNIIALSNERYAGAAKKMAISWYGLGSTLSDVTKIGLRAFFIKTFEGIQPYVERFVAKISSPEFFAKIEEIGAAFAKVLSLLKPVFDFLINNWQIVAVVVGGLAVLFGAVLVAALVAIIPLIGAFAGLVSGTMLTIYAAISVVTGVLALLTAAWINNWGDIRGKTEEVWNFLQGVFWAMADWLGETIPKVINTLSNLWNNTLLPAIKRVSSFINKTLIPAFSSVWEFISETLIPIITGLGAIFLLLLEIALIPVIWAIKQTLVPAFNAIWYVISTYVVPALTAIGNAIKDYVVARFNEIVTVWNTWLKPALESFGNFLRDNIMPIIKKFVEDYLDKTREALNKIKDAIDWVVSWLIKLKDILNQLTGVELPDWLQSHSPPPLQRSLEGIAAAMKQISTIEAPRFLEVFSFLSELNLQRSLFRSGLFSDRRELKMIMPAAFMGRQGNTVSNSVTNQFNQTVNSKAPVDQTIANFRLMTSWAGRV